MNRRRFLQWSLSVGAGLFLPSTVFGAEWKSKRVTVKATGYCPCAVCCGKHADGLTATGRNAFLAGVAIDPEVFDLGNHFDIPGYTRGPNRNGSWIIADDTGSKVRGNHIDIRFATHAEALKYGTRNIRVRVWYK